MELVAPRPLGPPLRPRSGGLCILHPNQGSQRTRARGLHTALPVVTGNQEQVSPHQAHPTLPVAKAARAVSPLLSPSRPSPRLLEEKWPLFFTLHTEVLLVVQEKGYGKT